MKKAVALLCITLSIIIFCSCGKTTENNTTESTTIEYKQVPSENIQTTSSTATETDAFTVITVPSFSDTPQITISETVQSPPITSQTQALANSQADTIPQTTKKELQKTGEMAFSDDANNKYIKAVNDKYGVDATRLAAIYTVPDNNGNLVFEFDGSADENGKLIRDESTLIAIYSVDKELTCKRASEDNSLNEYSYGEMKVMFITTTKHILPEFEKELNNN